MRLLSHNLQFPEIPPKVPQYASRQDGWERIVLALWVIAQGYCVRAEINRVVAEMTNTYHRSGAVMRLISKLNEIGLVFVKNNSLHLHLTRIQLHIVELSPHGKILCREFGWEIYENEWQRMKRLHEGDKGEERHTLAVLAFVYMARLRGYAAGVMPNIPKGWNSKPDALVERDGEQLFVEVELSRHVKSHKWQNMATDQGAIALCARNPKHREALLIDAQSFSNNVSIYATDLASLIKALSKKDYGPLWMDHVPG